MGTKLERKDVKVFASNPNHATQVSAFLTGKNETPDYTSDPNAIQNAYYPKGWFGDGENDLPQGTDMNGVMYAESYKNAYLYEMGIAEWSSTQEYFENSYCQVNGVLYLSLIDENLNNNPTTDDGTKWKEIALEPYTGENIGSAEGIYAGKTSNNELQFKGIAVSGNGNISASNDTITIEIGGGGTGDVYWGAIDGTLSNQSDLQQALNLKQNLIGYTPENVSNKVTTVRTSSVATDTAYASEKATRTAINNAIADANTYTDNALLNLSSDVFTLYAETWTDANTGTLTTTKPTGRGDRIPIIIGTTPTTIGTFTYTTTDITVINSSFFYDIYIQLSRLSLSPTANCNVNVTLTIQHPDVLGGAPVTLVNNDVSYAYQIITTTEIRTPIETQTRLEFPIGSTIKLLLTASATASGEITLIVYDQDTPIIISRNQYLKDISATCIYTQNISNIETQENLNNYMLTELNNCLRSFSATAPLSFSSNTLSISQADGNTNGYLTSTDWTTFSNKYNSANTGINMYHTTDTTTIRPVVEAGYTNSNIGTSSYPFTNGYINEINVATIAGTATSPNNITISSNLNPDSTANNRNLGSSSNKFYEGWVSYIKTSQLAAMGGGTKLNLGYNYMSPATADQYQLGYQNRFLYVYSQHFDQGSDIRNKSNIKDYDKSVLEKIKNITPITYNYKSEDRTTLGISAQELREIEPLVVHAQETKDGKDENLGIDLYSLCVFAIKAIKELNEKVETLEARIDELEGNKKELEK